MELFVVVPILYAVELSFISKELKLSRFISNQKIISRECNNINKERLYRDIELNSKRNFYVNTYILYLYKHKK